MNKLRLALEKLYENVEKQQIRYSKLRETYEEKFGDSDLHYFSTPGRTEIGGNHTDHNHGRVLAASINLDSIAVAARNSENSVVLYSEGYDSSFIVDLSQLNIVQEEQETTYALIRGIAARFKQLGYQTGGVNICMTSDVLPGSGLSSSASIEVLIGSIFNVLYNENRIAPEELAKIGQYAENEFFGKPSGLMDQIACAVGGIISIDFKDPHKPFVNKVNFDFNTQNYNVLVVDTGGNHVDLTEDYAAVPAEMKAVASAFNAEVLRDISKEQFSAGIPQLRKNLGDRSVLRSLHFISENERVAGQVASLESDDLCNFLNLVKASGNSSFKWLQNIYSTKNIQEQGMTLALALTEKFIDKIQAGACRVHGGGFAGTILVFLPENYVSEYVNEIEQVFEKGCTTVLSIRQHGTVYLNTFF